MCLGDAGPQALEVPAQRQLVVDLQCKKQAQRETGRCVDAVADVLGRLPRRGLISDLRANPGGVIDTAGQLFQLFAARRPIEPMRFAVRATEAMATIAEADGNGADFGDWAGSTRSAPGRSSLLPQRCSSPTAARWITPVSAPSAS